MATRYCWLKVIEATPEYVPEEPPQALATPDLADFAVWSRSQGALRTLITAAPRPAGQPLMPSSNAVVIAECAPCPPHGPLLSVAQRFLPAPPPSPTTVAGGPTAGWQLECGSIANNIDEPPKVLFACYPMEDGDDRDAALAWLASPAGLTWVNGAMACTLLSYFD